MKILRKIVKQKKILIYKKQKTKIKLMNALKLKKINIESKKLIA